MACVERVLELELTWCFTDSHAETAPALYYDDWGKRDSVDWDLMKSKWWNDDVGHPDRKRRRQAEFLVHEHVPWGAIDAIGVYSDGVASEVRELLAGATHRPAVQVERAWYY